MDAGSADGSVEIIRSHMAKDPRISLYQFAIETFIPAMAISQLTFDDLPDLSQRKMLARIKCICSVPFDEWFSLQAK